jgi:hypothetical protein
MPEEPGVLASLMPRPESYLAGLSCLRVRLPDGAICTPGLDANAFFFKPPAHGVGA